MNSQTPIQIILPLDSNIAENSSRKEESKPYTVASRTRYLRERLQQVGVQALSDEDLLLLVLRTGGGRENVVQQTQTLFARYSLQELVRADVSVFCQEHGLSGAKAAQVQAVLELARRLTIPKSVTRYQIITAGDAAKLVMPEMTFLDHEELRVLVLDNKNFVAANLLLYQGTVNCSVLRASEIFRPAITRKCPGIILCHNHPSAGAPEPSQEDIDVTKQLVQAAILLDMELVDHLIISDHRFISLRERLRW